MRAILEKLYLKDNLKKKEVMELLSLTKKQIDAKLKEYNLRKIKKSHEFPPLTQIQLDLIAGSLLGDGSLSPSSPKYSTCNWKFSKLQSLLPRGLVNNEKYLSREPYIEWHHDVMGDYSLPIAIRNQYNKMIKIGNKATKNVVFTSKSHPIFKELGAKWYPNGKKIAPEDLRLNFFSAAVWFCDDGVNRRKDRVAVLCTDSFTKKDNIFLSHVLKRDLGVDSHLGDRNRLYITDKEGYHRFLTGISEFVIWDCFKYKIDLSEYTPVVPDRRGESHHLSKINNAIVEKIFEMRKNGATAKQIGKECGVSGGYVALILKGEAWGHLSHDKMTPELSIRNTSGHKNIYFISNMKKYIAMIYKKGKNHKSRWCDTIEEALIEKEKIIASLTGGNS